MPPMEVVRQSSDIHTNGDIEIESKSTEESPQHVINNETVIIVRFLLLKIY